MKSCFFLVLLGLCVMSAKKSIKNSIWVMTEKAVSIISLFFISALVAKYIGPLMLGKITLAIAIFQVVQVIVQLGSENILFKRVCEKGTSGLKLLKVSFLIRVVIYILISIPVLYYSFYENDYYAFVFTVAVCMAFFFISIDVFSLYNDVTLNSKFNTITNVIGLFAGLSIRYAIVHFKMPPEYLAVSIVMTSAIPFLIRLVAFEKRRKTVNVKITKRSVVVYMKYLLATGLAMMLSSISVAIYPRINVFFLAGIASEEILGIYTVAMMLASCWSFIVLALITSFFPAIYQERNDQQVANKVAQLNLAIVFVSLGAALVFLLLGSYIINILYGPAYQSAYYPMLILCMSTMLSVMGTLCAKYIIKYAGYRYLSLKGVLTLLISIPISFFSIRGFGLTGAAMSAVFVELISLTALNYFFKNGIVLKMHIRTFLIIPISMRKIFHLVQKNIKILPKN